MSDDASTPGEAPHLVIVGSGGRPYREYSFATLAGRYRLSAVMADGPTWQTDYLDGFTIADLADPRTIASAVRSLAPEGTSAGLLTWDETVVESVSLAADKLGFPYIPPTAVAACRDKYASRSLMAQAGLPPVRHRLVTTADQAVAAAGEFGYPVVVKPRSLAGSVGVTRADDPAAVRAAFALTRTARYAALPAGNGVLVEEFLDGPEVSVDSVVFEGRVTCVHIAHKRIGYPPHFEETGHLVLGGAEPDGLDEVRELVAQAHQALGVTFGVTHAEVRLTSAGPRLIEVNARLGGDLIPYAGRLAAGVDLVRAAADLAVGRRPDLEPDRRLAAEVRFVYPPHDGTLTSLDLTAAAAVPGIDSALALAGPGTTLLLPPRQPIPRLAALVAVADDERGCGEILDRAERAVSYEMTG